MPVEATNIADHMNQLTVNMYQLGIVEAPDIRLVRAWVEDLNACGYEWPQVH